VNNRKVIFASCRAESLNGNLLYVYKEMVSRNLNLKIKLLLRRYKNTLLGKTLYFFNLIISSYHLATARLFIIDDYYFPVYVIKPRKRTEIIQLWHAAGAFKKFGFSTLGYKDGPSDKYLDEIKIHSNYSKVYVSSANVIPIYAEAFNMDPTKIIPLGVPRTDYFFELDSHEKLKKTFYYKYPMLLKRKLILYAPTFRGKSHDQNSIHVSLDIKLLKDILGEGYALLTHFHPYTQKDVCIDYLNDFVFPMNGKFSIEELMVISDVLVTDYSSIVFDFSLLAKPIAFFADDLKSYQEDRGFYFDYMDFIPGPFFCETSELAAWIKEGCFDQKKVLDFQACFFDEINGNATKRIVNNILENILD
jgi:CDP-ribitol ribitolphosphotransferase